MNKMIEAIKQIESLARKEDCKTILRDVFNYPDKSIMESLVIKFRNEVQLNRDLSHDDENLLTKYSNVLQSIVLSDKEPDCKTWADLCMKYYASLSVKGLTALEEVNPKIFNGDYYSLRYQNNRLEITCPPAIDKLIRSNKYCIDSSLSKTVVKHKFQKDIKALEKVLEVYGDNKLYKQILSFQKVRSEVFMECYNNLIDFNKKATNRIPFLLVEIQFVKTSKEFFDSVAVIQHNYNFEDFISIDYDYKDTVVVNFV